MNNVKKKVTFVLPALLGALTAINVAFAQDAPTIGTLPAPASSTERAPTENVTSEAPLAPRLPLQAGEILLEGRIEGVSFAAHELTISVARFTLPNGRSNTLATPRLKIVRFAADTPLVAPQSAVENHFGNDATTAAELRALTAGVLWPGRAVAVVGGDSGSGRPLATRLIEIGENIEPLYQGENQGQPQQLSPGSGYYNGVQEWVAASGLRAAAKFNLHDIGGRAPRPNNPGSDHPRGLALDFMVGKNAALGDTLAMYFQANAGRENIAYIIWKDTLVYAGTRTDWAKIPVDYTGNITARHMDHVHVSYRATPNLPGPYLTADLKRGNTLASRGAGRRVKTKKRR